jgi:hypothetical protein
MWPPIEFVRWVFIRPGAPGLTLGSARRPRNELWSATASQSSGDRENAESVIGTAASGRVAEAIR